MESTPKRKTRSPNFKATAKEFVQKLLELKSTEALAEFYGVSPTTISAHRRRLRKQGYNIPGRLTFEAKPSLVSPEELAEVNDMIKKALAP